jgi:lipopolysaccharide/colanic/teichoic acid biosynthesis glycosyltransferase
MGEVMSQGLDVEQDTRKWAGQTVSVVQELNGDNEHSTLIIGNKLVDETIQSRRLGSASSSLALQPSNGQEFLIRALDIVGAVLGLLISMPLLGIIALLVKISSDGPVIYRQRRVGKDGEIFTLYKFRTMVDHAEEIWGLQPASENDGRITPLGRILRRNRLDELPQLINILKGDMSLVGPRPENLYRVKLHKALRGARLAVKPGLTGLAQIRSFYDLKPEHKIRYDYLYIRRRSLLLNIYILLRTILLTLCRSKNGW